MSVNQQFTSPPLNSSKNEKKKGGDKKGIKQIVYYSFAGYIISFIQHCLSVFHRPFMVYGYYNRLTKRYLRDVRISSTVDIIDKEKFSVGDNVWINHYTRIDASGGVKIGEGCQIGSSVGIFSHSSHNAIRLMGLHYMKVPKEQRVGYILKPTEIGEYTFVGSGSYIMPGVKIGKGCIIGTNSVVTKDIPDFSVAVGSPAKVIKSTLEEDRAYFDDPKIREYYFDAAEIQAYQSGRLV